MLVETMRIRTKGFVRACSLAGFSKTVFVVDKGYASAENDEKWRSRRTKEVTLGERNMPFSVDDILCVLLEEAGA